MEFPDEKFQPRKDRYARSRGGSSEFLYVACGNCEEPVMVYQKDGPGQLLRCYLDRIAWPPELTKEQLGATSANIKEVGSLACAVCNNVIGNPTVYKPEDRPAYRLVQGSVHTYRSSEQAQARAKK